MNIFNKIIAGDELRPTRLHTEARVFVGWSKLLGLVPAAISWIRCHITGRCLMRPWWVWGAIEFVAGNLLASDNVLEIGSGYSSLWLAKRCGHVISIEESPEWSNIVSTEAKNNGLRNLEIVEGDSSRLIDELLNNQYYDVVVIDGPKYRIDIFNKLLAINKEKQPKLIIFDDTDKAEYLKAHAISTPGYEKLLFRGFKPQTVHACETTVFRKKVN